MTRTPPTPPPENTHSQSQQPPSAPPHARALPSAETKEPGRLPIRRPRGHDVWGAALELGRPEGEAARWLPAAPASRPVQSTLIHGAASCVHQCGRIGSVLPGASGQRPAAPPPVVLPRAGGGDLSRSGGRRGSGL